MPLCRKPKQVTIALLARTDGMLTLLKACSGVMFVLQEHSYTMVHAVRPLPTS